MSTSGPRYGDYKCIHDRTHRVCAKLVEDSQSCEEVRWPRPGTSEAVSFWDITGQQRWNWKRSVCQGPNPGDSWCICMWAAANLAAEVRHLLEKLSAGKFCVAYALAQVWEVISLKI